MSVIIVNAQLGRIIVELRDRIGTQVLPLMSRHDPTPMPYDLHIRERFNDDGSIDMVHCKRIYMDDSIVDAPGEYKREGR